MGFLLFPIYGLLMGLRLAALRAAGAPLKTHRNFGVWDPVIWSYLVSDPIGQRSTGRTA